MCIWSIACAHVCVCVCVYHMYCASMNVLCVCMCVLDDPTFSHSTVRRTLYHRVQ